MLEAAVLDGLCELSRLSLDEGQRRDYADQMAQIIGLMDVIGESDFPYEPVDESNLVKFSELRPDQPKKPNDINDVLRNSNTVRDNMFAVPKVFE